MVKSVAKLVTEPALLLAGDDVDIDFACFAVLTGRGRQMIDVGTVALAGVHGGRRDGGGGRDPPRGQPGD